MKKTFAMIMVSLIFSTSSLAKPLLCGPVKDKNAVMHAVKWYRVSAEQKAGYHQVFSMGTQYIQNWLSVNKPEKHTWGVILDIDETVLDNSWYYKECLGTVHRETDFERFVVQPQRSKALPGAVEFTHFVQQAGGYVSLVSNRDGAWKNKTGSAMEATVANLRKEDIAFDQVILANSSAKKPYDKNPRFKAIIQGQYDSDIIKTNTLPAHHVIAWFGDNIQDFPDFKQQSMHQKNINDKDFARFSQGYFIFANPIYGSWMANRWG